MSGAREPPARLSNSGGKGRTPEDRDWMVGRGATGSCPRQTETRQRGHGRGDSMEKHASVSIQVGHSFVLVPAATVEAILTVELCYHRLVLPIGGA